MTARAIMVQGTASHVGKSVLVAALCRLYARAGIRVAPFKAQNMSNNSFVTDEGGEIGRAQAFQAQAAGIEPTVDMNPILLKPDADTRSQVICLGQPVAAMEVRQYHDYQRVAWQAVTGAYDRLASAFDLIVLEGAGSPAEINLRDRDIVNMKMAAYGRAPVLLAADIERGGVFASIVGTMRLLAPQERGRVKGYLINKFRGEANLLEAGLKFLEAETGVPVLGVLPYVFGLPVDEEDAVALTATESLRNAALDIGVIHLPHISNATDFQPLSAESDVGVRYIETLAGFGRPDVIILPGCKSTVADFEWLQRQGLAECIRSHHAASGWLIGICGGYQMLGKLVEDPAAVESQRSRIEGLGLLPAITVFDPRKRLVRVEAECLLPGLEGVLVRGYEIHQGRSHIEGAASPAFRIRWEFGGGADALDGAALGVECFGTYLHGLFDHVAFRRGYLNAVRARKGLEPLPVHAYDTRPKDFDQLADWLRDSVDMAALERVVGLPLQTTIGGADPAPPNEER